MITHYNADASGSILELIPWSHIIYTVFKFLITNLFCATAFEVSNKRVSISD